MSRVSNGAEFGRKPEFMESIKVDLAAELYNSSTHEYLFVADGDELDGLYRYEW